MSILFSSTAKNKSLKRQQAPLVEVY